MEWLQKIIDALKGAKIVTPENEAAVKSELEKLSITGEQKIIIDTSKMGEGEVKKLVDGLSAKFEVLEQNNKDLLAALTKEINAREAAAKTQTEQAKTAQEKKINDAVDLAIKEGRYPEAKREHLKKLYTADFDSTAEMVKDTPVKKEFKQDGKTSTETENKGEVKSSLMNANKTVMDNILKMSNSEN